ncbi:MAG: antibiotic biosynthesis monooxygenase [gamma proteobacterium symbiont of Ctena orbiculata]|uniref:Antibiotic biosynthesis monooxygenase n=1 Tax=Candidatus Thiodiazotropha taylori TaxID=2792791 RepID=A0A944QU06_9GAMM|nr:antibiotic biosynthesis monooxygenase [Candidatus Thiodiazotropha taylori]PUB90060.1 MAG: antibiotic biosynthesis monooxygenase [gamma proteobacterium symbiont of Ctena orbiculata]MBT2989627.1 antibiotic biosynthesis monooxygenase [Candidatus Thiodiazotropha taylori]MBT2997207.1 antibiotic biosynthesis monooxygenase [Candidatus Thiodiazotropha taylori]MBT3001360.1 antibiotic biosynthesis monooxygenase [Candidatus Thiodiazotropha taylori]
MYAVIFKAVLNKRDSRYFETAERLRQLAKVKYGCLDFIAFTDDDREIAISYWPSREQIAAWKDDPEHRQAQHLGRTNWYRSYKVEVVKIEREYRND